MKIHSSNKNKNQIIGLSIILIFLIAAQILARRSNIFSDNKETGQTQKEETQIETNTEVKDLAIEQTSTPLPDSIYLDVPFQVQAPNANWNSVHEDACEEASLLMVYHFINKTAISDGDQELNKILEYETTNHFGGSVTLSDLNKIAQGYFGLKSGSVKQNISIDDIKAELVKGNSVIVGAAGKVLNNPNFRQGGPNYHMLVIKGYNKDVFITNDPGTRLGKDFYYNYDNLYDAIHDWNSENILNGDKNFLVFNSK